MPSELVVVLALITAPPTKATAPSFTIPTLFASSIGGMCWGFLWTWATLIFQGCNKMRLLMKKKKLYLIVAALLIMCISGWLFWLFIGSPADNAATESSVKQTPVDSSKADDMKKLIDEAKGDPEKSEG